MREAASVASAAFAAAEQVSVLSVASEASASAASFVAAVRASAKGLVVVVEVTLDKQAEVVEAGRRALVAS